MYPPYTSLDHHNSENKVRYGTYIRLNILQNRRRRFISFVSSTYTYAMYSMYPYAIVQYKYSTYAIVQYKYSTYAIVEYIHTSDDGSH